MRHPIILSPGEDGLVVADCPNLPGCVSQGGTEAEALANLLEAVELYKSRLPVFIVTSTGKNCDPRPCIESVAAQTYKSYLHHYIAADINTYHTVRGHPGTTRHSELGVVENVFRVWRDLADDHVIVWLDGDDWLANPRVLDNLAALYRARDPWLTYGSFRFSEDPGFTTPLLGTRYPDGQVPRRGPWRASHLKTFRAGLVKRVREEDLKRPDGTWTEFCTDRVFMLPMLEMAGERYEAVPEVLSVYNWGSSSFVKRPELREAEEVERARIHAMPEYDRLEKKPW